MKILCKIEASIVVFSFLSMMAFNNCTGFVDDVILAEQEPELVIHGYLFAGMDTMDIHIQKTHFIFASHIDFDQLVVNDAVVSIENQDGDLFEFTFLPNKGRYILPATQMPVLEGYEYQLKISHPSFPTAVSKATIPLIHSDFELVRLDSTFSPSGKTYIIETLIHDPPGEDNYYILFGNITGEVISLDEDGEEIVEPFSLRVFDYDELLSDKLFDGASYPKNSTVYMAHKYMPKKLEFTLFSIDKHYYEYELSIRALDILDIDPFATPVQLYSNIENARGVFAGYSIYVSSFDLVTSVHYSSADFKSSDAYSMSW